MTENREGDADPPQLMGLLEIAAYAGVTKSAVAKWKARHADFPRPVAALAMGDVYVTESVVTYLKRHGYPKTTK